MNNFEGFIKILDTNAFIIEVKGVLAFSYLYNEKARQNAKIKAELLADEEEQKYKEKVLDYMAKDINGSSQMLQDFEEVYKNCLVKKQKKVSYFFFFEKTIEKEELVTHALYTELPKRNEYFWNYAIMGELLCNKESNIETPKHYFPSWITSTIPVRIGDGGISFGHMFGRELYDRNEFVENVSKQFYKQTFTVDTKRLEQFIKLTGELYIPISDFNFIQETKVKVYEQV